MSVSTCPKSGQHWDFTQRLVGGLKAHPAETARTRSLAGPQTLRAVTALGNSAGGFSTASPKAFQTIPSNIPSSILYSGVVKGLLKQGRSPRSALGDTSEPSTGGHQPSPEELVPGLAAAGGGVVTGFTPISSGQLNPGDPSQFSTPALALREGRGLLSWTEAQWGAPATSGKFPSTPTFGPSLHFFACLTSTPHRNRGRRATRISFPHL